MPDSCLFPLSFLKRCVGKAENSKPVIPPKHQVAVGRGEGVVDCLGKRSWDVLEWKQLKACLTGKEGMTSGVFHGPGHCVCRLVGELCPGGLDGGKRRACLGEAKALSMWET